VKVDSPEITMSGGDAGASFYSCHDPSARTTLTVIGTTMGSALPVAEVFGSPR
jgi:hypothetical protein